MDKTLDFLECEIYKTKKEIEDEKIKIMCFEKEKTHQSKNILMRCFARLRFLNEDLINLLKLNNNK